MLCKRRKPFFFMSGIIIYLYRKSKNALLIIQFELCFKSDKKHILNSGDVMESIWIKHSELPKYEKLCGDIKTDVLIIGRYSKRTANLFVATGFNKWGMISSMAAAAIISDMILGKENPYAAVFSPSRSILHSQLAVNAFEAVTNLLSFSQKRCPHLGCALKWNPHERSWDCPCHGSRFDENGKLLSNPSNGDLPSSR